MECIGEPIMADHMFVEFVVVHILWGHAKVHPRCHTHIHISIHTHLDGVTYAKNMATTIEPIASIEIPNLENEWDLQLNNLK